MFAVRRLRRFSTNAAAPRPEYPTSFLSHLKTQKLNIFNIGIAFLTLSLSSQLVTFKHKNQKIESEKEKLEERVLALEQLVVSLGGTLPEDSEVAAAAEANRMKQETQQQREREEEDAKALAILVNGDDAKKPKKGMLI